MSRLRTLVLKVDKKKPDPSMIGLAAMIIRDGGIVGIPTETVYGLAVNRLDRKAVARLYRIKKRSRGKPLTVHIADVSSVRKLGCRVTRNAKTLIDRFWPGPLTIVLGSSGGRKVGFRMPANAVAQRIIALSGVPVVVPSANLSGAAPPKSAGPVLKAFKGKIDALVDSGPASVGVESTVVDLSLKPVRILREGAIGKKELSKYIEVR